MGIVPSHLLTVSVVVSADTGMEEGTSYAIEVAPYTVAKGETQKTVAASYTVTLTAGAPAH